ncbi:MAG TPA: hypothetical protein VNA69_12780 [Thermoanaerobaculia bacterium]|nr:hypothetical protein [Thermoanaerobaculia bacterium]
MALGELLRESPLRDAGFERVRTRVRVRRTAREACARSPHMSLPVRRRVKKPEATPLTNEETSLASEEKYLPTEEKKLPTEDCILALFVEAAPSVGSAVAADVVVLRDAIAFELAYGGVREEARALARRIDMAILRRKLKAVKSARGVYRVAKGFVTVDAGDAMRPHVSEMKRSLGGRRRRKNGASPAVEIATAK